MPAISERKALILEFDRVIRELAIQTDDANSEIDEVLDLKAHIESVRYLNLRTFINKNRSMNDMLLTYSDRDFRQAVRMDKRSFVRLHKLIEGDPIFKNKSYNKQVPSWVQLAVTLSRLGLEGNGGSNGNIGRNHGFSSGSVCKFVERVFPCIKKLRKTAIRWPTAEERKKISARYYNYFLVIRHYLLVIIIILRFGENHGLHDCVGIVDGTPVVFSQRPHIDGEVYWTRKHEYAMNLQPIDV